MTRKCWKYFPLSLVFRRTRKGGGGIPSDLPQARPPAPAEVSYHFRAGATLVFARFERSLLLHLVSPSSQQPTILKLQFLYFIGIYNNPLLYSIIEFMWQFLGPQIMWYQEVLFINNISLSACLYFAWFQPRNVKIFHSPASRIARRDVGRHYEQVGLMRWGDGKGEVIVYWLIDSTLSDAAILWWIHPIPPDLGS